MTQRHTWIAVFGLLTPLAACTHTDVAAGEPMANIWDAVDDAQTENDQHAALCPRLVGMPGMNSELERHNAVMFEALGRMSAAKEQMSAAPMMGMQACSGSSFDQLSNTLLAMAAAVNAHTERLTSAPTLDALRTECSAHQSEMDAMIQLIEGDLLSMPCMGAVADRSLNARPGGS